MNIKKFLAYLTVYAVVVISVPIFFNNMWLKDFPELKTYDGELKFSSSRAYEDLKYITVNFPKRKVGSDNAESSANWIAQEFNKLGLVTNTEEFTTRSPDKLLGAAIGANEVTTDDKKNETIDGTIDKTKEDTANDASNEAVDETSDLTANNNSNEAASKVIDKTVNDTSDVKEDKAGGIEGETAKPDEVTTDAKADETLDFNSFTMNKMFGKVKGINVIGVSKGKSDETIIIGAHRDTFGTIEGAQDNASGTVSMLELARVLTQKDHYYTYMFVSFDGEEIGLTGSEAFAQKHSLKNVKLAMILDCVGYKDADTAGLYQFTSAKGASPLWTTALANKIIKSSGRKEYYIDAEGGFSSSTLGVFTPLMNKMVSQRVSGDVNTDTGPFVDRNIPAVGFIAANADKRVDSEGIFHTPDDTISNVSVNTIDFIGKLSEQYIKSVELNNFSTELRSNLYLVEGNKYLDLRVITGFMVLIVLAFLLLWFISSIDIFRNPRGFIAFLRSERIWIIAIIALSAFSGFLWQLLNFNFGANLNLIMIGLLWVGVSFLGLITIIITRFIAAHKKGNYNEITKYQRILLNSIYILVFIAIAIYYNIFTAIVLIGTPLLIMGRVGYSSTFARVAWIIVTLIWFVFQTILLITCIESYLFDFLSMKTAILLFAYAILVAFTFVYVISAPSMPKKLEKPVEVF